MSLTLGKCEPYVLNNFVLLKKSVTMCIIDILKKIKHIWYYILVYLSITIYFQYIHHHIKQKTTKYFNNIQASNQLKTK